MKVKMTKEMIFVLNTMAHKDFERAQAMLDGINMVLDTEYIWINKRVAFVDDKSIAHDAYVYAE